MIVIIMMVAGSVIQCLATDPYNKKVRGIDFYETIPGTTNTVATANGNSTIAYSTHINISNSTKNLGVWVREYTYDSGYTQSNADRQNCLPNTQIMTSVNRNKNSTIRKYVYVCSVYANYITTTPSESVNYTATQYY